MAIRARERPRYWRGSAHNFALLGREGFLLLRVVIYATVSPQAAGIRARRHRSKLPYQLKPQGRCPPRSIRVALSNGSHLLTHRCIAVAARRLTGPIVRSLAAHLKTSHPPFPYKNRRETLIGRSDSGEISKMGDAALGVLATRMTLLNGMARSRIRKITPELRRPKRTER